MKIRTYSELRHIDTFEERYRYLKLGGEVGSATFGFDRHINQAFYKSREWRSIRHFVINRDNGCDLGVNGYDIHTDILIHHMNPLAVETIVAGDPSMIDPEFLITTTKSTHNAIHYGDDSLLPRSFVPRTRGDTTLW